MMRLRLFSLSLFSRRLICALLITPLLVNTGCRGLKPRSVNYDGPEKELNYYKDVATEVSYPILEDVTTPDIVAGAQKPRTIEERLKDQSQIWNLHLSEAIQMALGNNKIIRVNDRSSLLANNQSRILGSPDSATSVYDPAIQSTGVLFGSRGVEAALAAFDTQLTSTLNWGRNEAIQNNVFFSGGLADGRTLVQQTGAFTSSLQKSMATGGTFAVAHNMNYLYSNSPGNLFPSIYTGNVQASYRQPLLQGSGSVFTQTAGPLSQNIQGLSGVNQGVLIARINEDISIADFEQNVTNMLFDTEKAYWDLYLAYRQYDIVIAARDSALRSWREVRTKQEFGARGGGAADEAQARETYYARRAIEESTLANIDTLEISLRRMCGLSVNDGRIIRPADEPLMAELIPDWYASLAEGLTRRVELRRQKWNVKSLDLQLAAAKNLARPRFDFVSMYQVNAFGNDLIAYNDNDPIGTTSGLQSAYETLTQGNQTGWTSGFEFSMPLGLRAARSQVRNLELRVAKSREVLAQQEAEVTYELAAAFQDLARYWVNAETNFNRRRAAARQVSAQEAEYVVGTKTLDLVLQAQARLAEAEGAYYESLVQYTKSIAHINYRKGTLLEMNNVHLMEGQWSPAAYDEALARAWARSYAWDAPRQKKNLPEFGSTDVIGETGLIPEGAAPPAFTTEPVPNGESSVVPPQPPAEPSAEPGSTPALPPVPPETPVPPAPPAAPEAPVPPPPPAASDAAAVKESEPGESGA